MKNTTLSLLFLSFFTCAFSGTVSVKKEIDCFETTQIDDSLVVYVEASSEDDNAQVKAFILKLESYTDKIESCDYDYTNHEFSIQFTALITQEEILAMVQQEFGRYKIRN